MKGIGYVYDECMYVCMYVGCRMMMLTISLSHRICNMYVEYFGKDIVVDCGFCGYFSIMEG